MGQLKFPKLFAADLKLLMKFPDKFLPVLKFPKRILRFASLDVAWCRSYQGCRYCERNQLKVTVGTKIPVVEGLSMLTLQSLLNALVVFKVHRTLEQTSFVLQYLPMYVDLEHSENFSAEVSKNVNTTSLMNVGTKDSRKRWY